MKKKGQRFDDMIIDEKPEQLSLFSLLNPADNNYSNAVDVYDFLPIYTYGNQQKQRINGQFLKKIEHKFSYRGLPYRLQMAPARITDQDGIEREYFLGKREEMVELALRKLIVQGKGVLIDGNLGIKFSLYDLYTELARTNHEYSYNQIRDAIRIMKGVQLVIKPEGAKEVGFSRIESYGFDGEDNETVTFVRFSKFVTDSITENKFRMFNYDRLMKYKYAISRILEMRINHFHVRSDKDTPYNILLSTFLRDAGLARYEKISNNVRSFTAALDEMQQAGSVSYYEVEKRFDTRKKNTISDVKFTIYLNELNTDIIKANSKTKSLKEKKKLLSKKN